MFSEAKVKYLEDLRDIHEGEEIWVIGAGPSLDAYPLNFFKDKICIGVNKVFSVFVEIGDGHKKFESKKFYSVHEHRESANWIAAHIPHFLENCFFLLPKQRTQTGRSRMVWWEDYRAHNDKIHYMKWGFRGKKRVTASDQHFKQVVKNIVRKRPSEYVCRGTTLHWAIQVAAVLGAKKIYLAGADGGGGRMIKHGSRYVGTPSQVRPHGFIPMWYSGTKCLADLFGPQGLEIVYYFYGTGERKP